jgi:hypothetical protein
MLYGLNPVDAKRYHGFSLVELSFDPVIARKALLHGLTLSVLETWDKRRRTTSIKMGKFIFTIINLMESLMKPVQKEISITSTKKLVIKEQVIFQTGEEGKRIWESGIVMGRFIEAYPSLFKNKRIIEAGSGCGIAG